MTPEEVRKSVHEALEGGHFFAAEPRALRIEHVPDEEVAWELFLGHLLEPAQTDQRKRFESWDVYYEPQGWPPPAAAGSAPVLSVKLDLPQQAVHIMRNVLVHGWEAYEDSPGVIQSRPVVKWKAEQIGTLDLARNQSADRLRDELCEYLWLAVIGTSRLPITSWESPLPAFSLGQLSYLPTSPPRSGPYCDWRQLIAEGLAAGQPVGHQAKLVEAALRSAPAADVPHLAHTFWQRCEQLGLSAAHITGIFHTLFNGVALSPYTLFADNLVAGLVELAGPDRLGPERVIDLFSYMLRQLVRHLTAYDLVLFHHAGANYPDALTLDSLLRTYLTLIDGHPQYVQASTSGDGASAGRRRRALRQAWLVRKQYEGHLAPDAPTSPGENLRVLPEPFIQVPEEQIYQPARRRKALYAGEPLELQRTGTTGRVLAQSLDDLERPGELRELGTALYLDRPLGVFKQPGEVDRTALVAYEAFSAQLARRRLHDLARWELITGQQLQQHLERLEQLPVLGWPVSRLPGVERPGPQRPGVVALEEAAKAAPDFVFLRTMRQSLSALLQQYDWQPLQAIAPEVVQWLFSGRRVLLIRTAGPPLHSGQPLLAALDDQLQPRLELGAGGQPGTPVVYKESRGIEYLRDGLQVLGFWPAGLDQPVRPDTLLLLAPQPLT